MHNNIVNVFIITKLYLLNYAFSFVTAIGNQRILYWLHINYRYKQLKLMYHLVPACHKPLGSMRVSF